MVHSISLSFATLKTQGRTYIIFNQMNVEIYQKPQTFYYKFLGFFLVVSYFISPNFLFSPTFSNDVALKPVAKLFLDFLDFLKVEVQCQLLISHTTFSDTRKFTFISSLRKQELKI